MSIASANSAIPVQDQGIPSRVTAAVRYASHKAGVDFPYLLAKAAAESGFQADAKAPTSSATGLFQFVDRTWLDIIEQHGAKYGLVQYADALRKGEVDPDMKERILALRENPRISALMAAELTRSNKQVLERTVGGEIGDTELYMAHFLGAGSAAKFLNAMEANPDQPAAELLPQAARANKAIFYDHGKPLSLEAVRDELAARMTQANDAALAMTAPKSRGIEPIRATGPVRAYAEPVRAVVSSTPAPALSRTFLPPLSMETQLFLAKLPIPGESSFSMA